MIIESHPSFIYIYIYMLCFSIFPDVVVKLALADRADRGNGDKLWRSMWMGMRAPGSDVLVHCQ